MKIDFNCPEVVNVPKNIPEAVSSLEDFQALKMAISNTPEVVSPVVMLPQEEDISHEVAHSFTEVKITQNYEISMNYVHKGK